jgi:two-component system NarL family sensor kinase
MPNDYPEIYIQFLTTVVVTLVLIGCIVTILLSYQKKKILQQKKMAALQAEFEKELLQTRLEIQEEVLKNISMEIHDNIGQIMLLANVNASLLQALPMPPGAPELIQETKKLLSKAIEDITSLSRSLHSDRITEIGIFKAMGIELEMLEKKGLFSTEFNTTAGDGPILLTKDVQLVLFRIFQEVSKNIIKHAQASKVTVNIDKMPDGFSISITDNGIGLPAAKPSAAAGIGMRSMQDRVSMIGGKLELVSQPGQGTSVRIFVPNPDAQR